MRINISSYVSVIPRICKTHTDNTFTISPLYDFVSFEGKYRVIYAPRFYFNSNDRTTSLDSIIVTAIDNQLSFEIPIGREQEYIIYVVPEDSQDTKVTKGILTSIYALDEDLLNKKVMKGDLHQHTTFSDGIENPEHRIIECRRNGFDFFAITDHNNYGGSERAASIIERIPINMIAVHGEEVHADQCPVHILSLGTKCSVVPSIFSDSKDGIRLESIKKKYENCISSDVNLNSFAAAINVFDRIREYGGISVLCHIYWESFKYDNSIRMGAPEQLIDELVKAGGFDAFEITSGAPGNDLYANYLQESYYYEMLPDNFPIIGVTDSHTTLSELSIFGQNYTIVFVDECSEEGIIDAIRMNNVVAYDGVGNREILHGSLRLRKYAIFLVKEYFPYHDRRIGIEGEILERVLEGDHTYLNILEKIEKDLLELMRGWTIYGSKR